MNSYRIAALVVASVFMVLLASAASACSCNEMSDKEMFAGSDLVVRGRMKSVTVGVDVADPKMKSETFRMTRGEFEVEKVLKGTFKGKTLLLHTGFGTGDCGRLAEFIGATYWYRDKKNGVFEFGMSKTEIAGQPFYHTGICDYAKFAGKPE
ncbi:hypothetical protein AMK06_CH02792 [Rhizobium sp. N541]|uniref:hypothetical protein n=1 Tax=unclassified Rhizobium TaxID=2613769 RepID=UPI0007EE4AE8|nr:MULTISPECIES: hypothetical protein [unclassified Rhizobium]ANM17680.1 hypothetical protein AMK06_CH02792 [Rhizobium sp. N541]ANM24066.1 hypothetical protein AMK07_CH02790 [Rhizobium sp. N941]